MHRCDHPSFTLFHFWPSTSSGSCGASCIKFTPGPCPGLSHFSMSLRSLGCRTVYTKASSEMLAPRVCGAERKCDFNGCLFERQDLVFQALLLPVGWLDGNGRSPSARTWTQAARHTCSVSNTGASGVRSAAFPLGLRRRPSRVAVPIFTVGVRGTQCIHLYPRRPQLFPGWWWNRVPDGGDRGSE